MRRREHGHDHRPDNSLSRLKLLADRDEAVAQILTDVVLLSDLLLGSRRVGARA
jgi:hypothetical protein